MSATSRKVASSLQREVLYSLHTKDDLDPLLERIGDARFVLLGEASHGTSEYYLWRTRLSQRLIEEKGFSFIAVEGDWPDCYQINRYIKHYSDAKPSAVEVLHEFGRWPTWMWANWEVVALVEWLKIHNQNLPPEKKVGFYGLDVYSLWESLGEITSYLKKYDPGSLAQAQRAKACFEPYNQDAQSYALMTRFVPSSCEDDVVKLLTEIQKRLPESKPGDREDAFNAEQNALVAVGAERYYREMVRGGPGSWNIRDTYMVATLERLMNFHGSKAKVIVWEHNTHIGDARATDMAKSGMVNVGQLVRSQRSQDGVVLVGFGSYEGSVIAGKEWDAPMEVMPVPEARRDSWEAEFHRTIGKDGLLIFPENDDQDPFRRVQAHRAIGVVYDPEQERWGNYVSTSLSQRYDAFLYIDKTHALHPLHIEPDAHLNPPETYPWKV
jgi:erythromycin esterase